MCCGPNVFCLYDGLQFVVRYGTGCGFCDRRGGLSKFHCKLYQDVVCRNVVVTEIVGIMRSSFT